MAEGGSTGGGMAEGGATGGGMAGGATGGGMAEGGSTAATSLGAPIPSYRLEDVQPESCGYEAVYGLSTFSGRVTVVALLSGWCPYCQAQASGLEAMRRELVAEGLDVAFVIVNSSDAIADQGELTSRSDFAVLQDLETVGAFALHHQAKKDDIVVYDAEGLLYDFFPAGGERTTNLEASQGRENLRNAIYGAAAP